MEIQSTASARAHAVRRAAAIAGVIAAAGLGLVVPGAASASTPADPSAYCDAHVALEAAMGSGDPAVIEPAVEAATAAAPADIADALGTAVANAPTDGPPSEEFNAAYGQVVDWVVENCGFSVVDVLATEYQFGGLPSEVPAGPTVIRLTNEGEELHEIVLVQRLEGTTETAEELLALPEEEAFSKVAFINAAFAMPGESGAFVADLAPGDYIAVCFIPVGTTPEVFAEMMAAPEGTGMPPMDSGMDMGSEPAGTEVAGSAPAGSEPRAHYMEGMVQEFTVVDGAAAPATTGA